MNPFRLFFAHQDGVVVWGSDSGFNTKTDDHGRFVFDFVPAGHFGVNGAGIGERVTVKFGETAVVKLGGSGRPVTGKFQVRNTDEKIELADVHAAFFTSMADFQAMADLSRGKTREEMEALIKRPIQENTFTNFHTRPVQCGQDGSFRIDQVDPGKYALVVASTMFTLTGGREVEIPAGEPKTQEPLDLGTIEVSLSSLAGSTQ